MSRVVEANDNRAEMVAQNLVHTRVANQLI